MNNFRPALLIATVLLAGCAGSGSQTGSASQSTWWNPVSWSWSGLNPVNWFVSSLQIAEQGVGGVNGSTPLQQKAIEDGLKGQYTLRNGMRMVDGSVVSFWQALDDSKQVEMELSGRTTVNRIEVMDKDVATDSGVKIGTRFSDLYSKAFESCKKGTGADRDGVECRAPNSQHISYVFSGDWRGPEGLMPSDDTLKNWTVSKIIWHSQNAD
ncbi:RpoE-regulated lipoprotein [Pantoea coffeiphila]|uniref:RpoE-regulated lipoprotein n=1 Tax=Pantoea coffeiphila TaxID=1465635 RepID=A0A2S9IB67_9GAMM|nr:RpoE-regulated lipoprotein [Pantoea coffeiphila]PRD15018.1 RpoE-regulated lipoprotein [Pantoea coffeiphila]